MVGLAPLLLILLVICAYTAWFVIFAEAEASFLQLKAAAVRGTLRCLPFCLVLTFVFAAPISADIFQSWLCESYVYDSALLGYEGSTQSFL